MCCVYSVILLFQGACKLLGGSHYALGLFCVLTKIIL